MTNVSSNLDIIDPDDNFFNELFPNSDQTSGSKYYSTDMFKDLNPCSTYNLSLINYNVRSFNKNGRAFEAWLLSMPAVPSFVTLTETWNLNETKQLCNIDGYTSVHTHRVTSNQIRGGPGGGVSVLFLNKFNCEQIDHLSYCNETIESCVCGVSINGKSVVIVAVYRPHTDNIGHFTAALESILLDNTVRQADVVFVAGDMNIDVSNQARTDVNSYIKVK